MSDLTFNAALVAKSFDANNNNQVQDDIKFSAAALAKVDTDKNGQVSVAELTTAIEKDAVVISNGAANVPKGKVTIANILGASDALDNANSAVVQAVEQLKPLEAASAKRGQYLKLIQARNAQLGQSEQMFTMAINMSKDRWTGETIKDDTFYRAVNGRKDVQARMRANNELYKTVSRMDATAPKATLQAKAREIYDIGVKMTAIGKTTSKSEIAQMKAQLSAISATVAATGEDAANLAAIEKGINVQ